ncbi:MAG: RICIN domain-containing protein [Ignavibacteriaceae bacterium]|nr:RICIN domain-containing protein [Ignavibacteriaceae bacterium]
MLLRISIFLLIFFSVLYPQSINDLIPKGTAFFIQSAQNEGKPGGYWDISGGEDKIRTGAEIQVYNLEKNEKDRRYAVKNSQTPGYVNIHIAGVAGNICVKGNSSKNGTKLALAQPSSFPEQNFTFRYVGNGRFKIYNQNGSLITLAGRKSSNGSDLVMWEDHEGLFTEWLLINVETGKPLNLDAEINKLAGGTGDKIEDAGIVYIQSAISYGKNLNGYFDVPGVAEAVSGNNLQVYWLSDFNDDRKYQIIPSNSNIQYYSIALAENNTLLVDAGNPSSPAGTNISLVDMNNSEGQNFSFRHLGNGRYKIVAQNGKVISLANRTDANSSNIQTGVDESGAWTEWYLIDVNTNQPYLPKQQKGGDPDISSVVLSPGSDPDAASLAAEIDNMYREIGGVEGKSASVVKNLLKSGNALSDARNVSIKVNSLNSKVNDINDAIVVFERLPFIGPAVKVMSTSLDYSGKQLGRVDAALGAIKDNVIEPSVTNMQTAMRQNILLNSQIRYLKQYLVGVKQQISGLSKDGISYSKNDFAVMRQKISELTLSFSALNKSLSETEKNCKLINKIDAPAEKIVKGVKGFDKSIKQVDKIADEINKVLDKRFKKEIAKVKINISVRDVLEGGKVGKIAEKYVGDFVEDALKPVLKKLKIKMPEVPGADEFKNLLTESVEVTKKIRGESASLDDYSAKIASLIAYKPVQMAN